jgi:shikimate kinase
MGSGKSSLGRKLAHKLNLSFIDLDEIIEKKEKRSIADIFNQEGENKFREIEQDCLKDILHIDNTVVSTGGGTPCFFNNMELINRNGISIYLKYNPGILASRLSGDKGKRPLLKHTGNKKDFQDLIGDLLAKREIFYLQSRLIVEEKNVRVKKIISMLENSE